MIDILHHEVCRMGTDFQFFSSTMLCADFVTRDRHRAHLMAPQNSAVLDRDIRQIIFILRLHLPSRQLVCKKHLNCFIWLIDSRFISQLISRLISQLCVQPYFAGKRSSYTVDMLIVCAECDGFQADRQDTLLYFVLIEFAKF